jgi:hypothetical protein
LKRTKLLPAIAAAAALALVSAMAVPASAHRAGTGDPYPHYPDVSQTVGVAPGTILFAHAVGLNEPGAVLSTAIFCSSDGNIQPQDGRQCNLPDLSGLSGVTAETNARVRATGGQLTATALGFPADGRATCPPSAAQQLAAVSCGVAVAGVTGALAPVAFGFRQVALTGQIPMVDGTLAAFKAPAVKATAAAIAVKFSVVNGGTTTIDTAGALPSYLGAPSTEPFPGAVAPTTRATTLVIEQLPAHRMVVVDATLNTLGRDDNADGVLDTLDNAGTTDDLVNGNVITMAAKGPLPLALGASYIVANTTATSFQVTAGEDADPTTVGFQQGPVIDITGTTPVAAAGVPSKATYRGGQGFTTAPGAVADTLVPAATLAPKGKGAGLKTWSSPGFIPGTLIRFTLKTVISGRSPLPAGPGNDTTLLDECDNSAPLGDQIDFDNAPLGGAAGAEDILAAPCNLADWNLNSNFTQGTAVAK